MPTSNAIAVEGLAELSRAFRVADKTLQRELRDTLKDVAEPVKRDAETLAARGIPRLGFRWSQFRIGVTAHSVYIAPKRRGARAPQMRRPNLAGLLLGRSMLPAIERNQSEVIHGIERMLDDVSRAWERA